MENLILKSVRFNAFVIKVLLLFAVIIFSSCNGGDGIVKCEMPKNVTSFGVYMDSTYFEAYPDTTPLKEYGEGLRNYTLSGKK